MLSLALSTGHSIRSCYMTSPHHNNIRDTFLWLIVNAECYLYLNDLFLAICRESVFCGCDGDCFVQCILMLLDKE